MIGDDELNLDFTFEEVSNMESIPWYKTTKEVKEEKEAKND